MVRITWTDHLVGLVDRTASAPARTPASRRMSAIGTPIQRALPTYGPPTSLETQVRVTSRSTSRRARMSSKPRSSSLSTRPCTRRRQLAESTCGTVSDVSTR